MDQTNNALTFVKYIGLDNYFDKQAAYEHYFLGYSEYDFDLDNFFDYMVGCKADNSNFMDQIENSFQIFSFVLSEA